MGSAHLSPDRPCPFCQGTGKYREGDAQSPRDLPPLPVMGYPGWFPGNGVPAFYEDARHFRGPSAAGR